jgi:hypothetical protein
MSAALDLSGLPPDPREAEIEALLLHALRLQARAILCDDDGAAAEARWARRLAGRQLARVAEARAVVARALGVVRGEGGR